MSNTALRDAFPNIPLTALPLESPRTRGKERVVDAIFVLGIVALYAVTHWLVWAIERLRSPE